MSAKRLLAAAAALAVAMPCGASAATMYAVYRGHITAGHDDTGEFGDPGVLASGRYTAIYRYDTALGDHQQDAFHEIAQGGPGIAPTQPIVGATLTIKGRTFDFAPAQYMYGIAKADNYLDQPTHYAQTAELLNVYNPALTGAFQQALFLNFAPPNLTTPFHGRRATTQVSSGDATWLQTAGVGGAVLHSFDLHIVPDRVIVTADIASVFVPEPETWTMLVLGLGGAGAVLRRRFARGASLGS